MSRRQLLDRLTRLLGEDGLREAGVDVDSLETTADLPLWLQRLAEAAETLPLPEVPPTVSQDLRRVFDVSTFVEAQKAVLVDDTRRPAELAGVRGIDPSESWSLTYTSGVADVVLDVWPQGDGQYEVTGQVMAHRAATSAYRAEVRGPTPARADGDRLGRFRIGPLAAGRYTMVIGNGEIEVLLSADLAEAES